MASQVKKKFDMSSELRVSTDDVQFQMERHMQVDRCSSEKIMSGGTACPGAEIL